jgi:hypothetical protein
MASVLMKLTKSDGTVLDDVTLELDDMALDYAIEAMAVSRGYSEGYEVTKARWFTWEIRKYVEAQVAWYAKKQAEEAAAGQASALLSTVVVNN